VLKSNASRAARYRYDVTRPELTPGRAKIGGPVKASFSGKGDFVDLDPPTVYTIPRRPGRRCGFAKGGARCGLGRRLSRTICTKLYDVHGRCRGKISQLFARLSDGTPKKLAGHFFEKFRQHLAPKPEGERRTDGE